jgi:tRNA (guanine10-N2)-methyltransferase
VLLLPLRQCAQAPSEDVPGIMRAAEQYGVAPRVLGLATFDVTQNPWRRGELFDAIVTDPPCASARRARGAALTCRLRRRPRGREAYRAQEGARHARYPAVRALRLLAVSPLTRCARSPDLAYVPPTKPYELAELAADLVLLARYLLVPGGRLVFFLPTVTDEYADVDVDGLVCDGIQLVANSLQDFGSWGRRVRGAAGRDARGGR